jgi:hypothetical protein
MTPKKPTHRWAFKPRFRAGAFGWKSQPAIARIKEAVAEIKKVAKDDPLAAAEGAVVFLERVSPAIAHVDGSSGSIGAAVNRAIAELAPIVGGAPAPRETHEAWLERLWQAQQADEIPYLEALGDAWGALCGSKEVASAWADRLEEPVRSAWSAGPGERRYFKGTTNCLSALLAAGRHEDLLALLARAPYDLWHDRRYGVSALAAQGKIDEAIAYAEGGRSPHEGEAERAAACEEILLAAGRVEEAYRRHGLRAAGIGAGTYLGTFRAVARKYPHKPAAEILADLAATTPGDEGKWFAAAKDAKLFDEALALAGRSPCDPKTLTRAARDHADERPAFAKGAGLLALRWLVEGYGYEITGADVLDAYAATLKAAEALGEAAAVKGQIRALVAAESFGERFVTKILGRELGIAAAGARR